MHLLQYVRIMQEQSIKIEDLEGELKAKNLELEEAESKCIEIEALKVKLKHRDEELRNREANLKGLSKIIEIDTKVFMINHA